MAGACWWSAAGSPGWPPRRRCVTGGVDVTVREADATAGRQDPNVDVRGAGDRRGSRRVPRPHARSRPTGSAGRTRRAHVADGRDRSGVARRAARHPRRDRARRAGRAADRSSRPGCCRGAASCGPRANRSFRAPRRPTTCSARTSGDASATRSTSASSTRSSAASTQPTPTTPASKPSRSWPSWRAAAGACCSRRGARGPGRAASAAPGPIFAAPTCGVGALVDAVAATVQAAGGEIRTSSPVTSIDRDGAAWVVDDERFDAIALTITGPGDGAAAGDRGTRGGTPARPRRVRRRDPRDAGDPGCGGGRNVCTG